MKKGQKLFIEIGNIFEFAESRLQKKVSRGDMEYYTAVDVIDNAVKIREYLDNHNGRIKIPTQTKEERKFQKRKTNMQYYWGKTKGYCSSDFSNGINIIQWNRDKKRLIED